MLTKEQQLYFFNLYKNAFYLDDKLEIEESLKEIEKPEVRKNRDRLLKAAEKNATTLARKVVNKIKHKSIEELETLLNSENHESFGEDLLKEIESELEK